MSLTQLPLLRIDAITRHPNGYIVPIDNVAWLQLTVVQKLYIIRRIKVTIAGSRMNSRVARIHRLPAENGHKVLVIEGMRTEDEYVAALTHLFDTRFIEYRIAA